mgnify:CR=1 FL=1
MKPNMRLLTEPEFLDTMKAPMIRASADAEPPFDFWEYFETIPIADFQGRDCGEGNVRYVWARLVRSFR